MDPAFFGEGGPVPQVDPEDVKTVWTIYADVAKRHPGKQVAVGAGLITASCRPGANVAAVCYRAGVLQLLIQHGYEDLTSWMNNGEPGDALFRAAAQTSMEWMGEGLFQRWPLDIYEFLRLARGEITG